ncbi:MAG TPA: M90 family metallopeptidase [Candidatus Saccharimonadia bacterium]|nr:M90 family metallopeptidase [Candidatus Saccharimonadia bacterium]
MFGFLRRLRRPPPQIPDATWHAARARLRLLDAWDPAAIERLRERAAAFIAHKAITPARELELDDTRRVIVAALCCLPAINLGPDALNGWREVIVYPGQFRVRRHSHDDESSVVTEWDDELAGESWSHGPVILSWADVEQDLAEPFEGLSVVVHEIAHKLDMADGDSDGIPPLSGDARRAFKQAMHEAYDALCAAVDAGGEPVMDPYAAESHDEFFAVASEYYFSAPDVLAEHYPGVHRALASFYGPVPLPDA